MMSKSEAADRHILEYPAFENQIRERAAHLAGIFQEIGLEGSVKLPPEINVRIFCVRMALDYINGEICHHCFPGFDEIRENVLDEARIEEGLILPS